MFPPLRGTLQQLVTPAIDRAALVLRGEPARRVAEHLASRGLRGADRRGEVLDHLHLAVGVPPAPAARLAEREVARWTRAHVVDRQRDRPEHRARGGVADEAGAAA